MIVLKVMRGITRNDKIRNLFIGGSIRVVSIEDKIERIH